MAALDLGRIGFSLDVSDDGTHLTEAGELEALGYGTIWLAGGQLDTLERLADVVRATQRVPVAAGIIPLDRYRHEDVLALYHRLETTHPGRLVVGLGGPQQSARPMRAMHDFLDHLDAAEAPIPAERRILAALGPRKLALARQRFAGAVPLLVTPAYTASARGILGPDATLVISQPVVLDTDPDRARDAARGMLTFLLTVAGYRENVRRMGFDERDIAGPSDRLVDALTSWGTPAAIAARVAEHLEAGADQVDLSVVGDGTQPTGIEAARILAPYLLG